MEGMVGDGVQDSVA